MSKISILKEFFVVFESAEKMVAVSDHILSSFAWRFDNFYRGLSFSSIYLYFVLMFALTWCMLLKLIERWLYLWRWSFLKSKLHNNRSLCWKKFKFLSLSNLYDSPKFPIFCSAHGRITISLFPTNLTM